MVENYIKSNRTFARLCFLYICLISFQHLFELPIVGYKIQPAEILFIGIFLFGLNLFWEQKETLKAKLQINIVDKALMLFFLTLLPSTLFNWGLSPVLEVIGLVYLFCLYASFRFLQLLIGYQKTYALISKAFLWASVIAVVHGVFGLFFTSLTGNDKLAEIYPNFPYVGDIIRMHGWAMSPNMLMSIFAITFFLNHWTLDLQAKKRFYPILFLGILLTFSKSWFIFLAAFLFAESLENTSALRKYFYCFSGIGLIFLYVFLGHFYVQPASEIKTTNNYRSNSPIIATGTWEVFPTTYTLLKKSALQIGTQNLWTGVGLGNFSKEIEKQKKQGTFESHIPTYDPHSTYFGIFAEGGIFALLGFFYYLTKVIQKIAKTHPIEFKKVGFAILIFILAEAISTDVLHFKQYWVLLALIPNHLKITIFPNSD